jgi:hypothetical protein
MASISSFSKPSFGYITGRFLSHTRMPNVGRAFLAADLHAERVMLVDPTLTQAARLARVNYTLAWWATRRQEQRSDIMGGLLPLVPPPSRIHTVSDPEVVDFVRSVGVAGVFDIAAQVEATEQLISAEQFLEREIQNHFPA